MISILRGKIQDSHFSGDRAALVLYGAGVAEGKRLNSYEDMARLRSMFSHRAIASLQITKRLGKSFVLTAFGLHKQSLI